MLNDGNWLRVKDVNNGDTILIKDEGIWQESKFTYDDGNAKNDFVIKIEHNGEEKIMTLNKKNRTSLIEVYGTDTANWVGKTVELTKKTIEVGGVDREAIRFKISDQGEAKEIDQTEIPF